MVLKYKNNSINKISSRKFTSPGEHYLAKSTFSTIMPNTRRHSYNLNFKLKIVVEAEAVNNNREIAREYGNCVSGSEVAQSVIKGAKVNRHSHDLNLLPKTFKRMFSMRL